MFEYVGVTNIAGQSACMFAYTWATDLGTKRVDNRAGLTITKGLIVTQLVWHTAVKFVVQFAI